MEENKSNLFKAVIAVMQEVKGIEKNLEVGVGRNSYKGISDKDVKLKIGEAMRKNGLCILPVSVEPKTVVNTWEEVDQYSKATPKETKQKQSVFTEVKTTYLLGHTSGESQIISGYGQGVDPQDKGAGKATTYALKYTLMYTFMVASGYIDDADATLSNEYDEKGNVKAVKLQVSDQEAKLRECKTLVELQNVYTSFKKEHKVALLSLKDELKLKLK